MIDAQSCSNMGEIREAIDSLDSQLVKLIAKRSEYVNAAVKFKNSQSSVRDDERVKQVLLSKRILAEENGISPDLIESIYRTMIDFFINEEMRQWKEIQ